jgi:hypothetical protein
MLVVEIAPGLTRGFISGFPRAFDHLHAFDRDDGVEARARGIHADPVRNGIQALLLHHLRHREDLGDRLNRYFGLDVAGGVDLAVRRHERDAEQIRIDLRQCRDVVGVLAFLQRPELRVGVVDRGLLGPRLPRRQRDRHRDRYGGNAAHPEQAARRF